MLLNITGASYNYTAYFEKYRRHSFKQRESNARMFVQSLEQAIHLSIRMTGGGKWWTPLLRAAVGVRVSDVAKIFSLQSSKRRLQNAKQCNVCQYVVWSDAEHSTYYFRASRFNDRKHNIRISLIAEKAEEDSLLLSKDKMVEWKRETANTAEQLNNNEVRIFDSPNQYAAVLVNFSGAADRSFCVYTVSGSWCGVNSSMPSKLLRPHSLNATFPVCPSSSSIIQLSNALFDSQNFLHQNSPTCTSQYE